jgi:hypothetical protein
MNNDRAGRAADLYLLISCLNAGIFAITQLNPDGMNSQDKMTYKNLRNFMHNFLKGLERKATKEQISELYSYNFDNVAAMTELVATVALLPPTEVEWFSGEVQKLAFAAVNRASSK